MAELGPTVSGLSEHPKPTRAIGRQREVGGLVAAEGEEKREREILGEREMERKRKRERGVGLSCPQVHSPFRAFLAF